ncbi:hypothetical protein [Methylobacterium persicinum]|uniref:DUF4410 domain-containing protein n=1 Tax=Methylobacterium persicinum TaxID=374426 RepID=A0ABU0HQ50_9HYPH|nr:hypothetical protein [Methylobacterium persicinum]MDQ0443639.1 hypothetical protein [Methylobacterium persicinum]GJE36785.1 hypothetical protein KHHGKMAE_0837 [Methylobacterium persicinum]
MSENRQAALGAAVSCLVAAGVLGLAPMPARAGDLPAQGEYHIYYTGLNPSPTKPVQIGPQRSVTVSTSVMTAVNAAGSGLLHNMAGRCTGMPAVDAAAKTMESHGYSDYVDADGDHAYEKWDYPVQPLAQASEGTGEWIGGTGKFAGLSGRITIKSQRLNTLADGMVQVVGEKTGTYTLGAKTASEN